MASIKINHGLSIARPMTIATLSPREEPSRASTAIEEAKRLAKKVFTLTDREIAPSPTPLPKLWHATSDAGSVYDPTRSSSSSLAGYARRLHPYTSATVSTFPLPVYCSDKMVGHYHLTRPLTGPSICVHLLDGSMVTVQVEQRREVINQLDMARMPRSGSLEQLLVERGVPSDATQSYDMAHDERVYTWNALNLNLNEYECIFDQDEFYPV